MPPQKCSHFTENHDYVPDERAGVIVETETKERHRDGGHLFNATSPFYEKVKYEHSKAHNTFTRKDRQTFLMSMCAWVYATVSGC